jgi:hypothetical protein
MTTSPKWRLSDTMALLLSAAVAVVVYVLSLRAALG